MVEALNSSIAVNCDDSMAVEDGDKEEDRMEVVIKPRNRYTSNALRQAVPAVDLRKKRESLTMSIMNMSLGGSKPRTRGFGMNSKASQDGNQFDKMNQSCNVVAAEISFMGDAYGQKMKQAIRSHVSGHGQIDEENSDEDSSEQSDPTSSSESEGDSFDNELAHGADTEDAIYQQI